MKTELLAIFIIGALILPVASAELTLYDNFDCEVTDTYHSGAYEGTLTPARDIIVTNTLATYYYYDWENLSIEESERDVELLVNGKLATYPLFLSNGYNYSYKIHYENQTEGSVELIESCRNTNASTEYINLEVSENSEVGHLPKLKLIGEPSYMPSIDTIMTFILELIAKII